MEPNKEDYSKFYDKVYSKDNPRDGAHGLIQWKGTSVCMDVHCSCGEHCHIDAEFFYHYRCPNCQKVFTVGQNIKLIELTQEDIELGGIEEEQITSGVKEAN